MKAIGYMFVAVLTAVYTSAWWLLKAVDNLSAVGKGLCIVICIAGTCATALLIVSYLIIHWDEIWGIKTK